jgi:hypothetical protein
MGATAFGPKFRAASLKGCAIDLIETLAADAKRG